MITDKELEFIEAELGTGKVHAITAYRTIWALKNQQRHILQLRAQLKNCQSKCKSPKTNTQSKWGTEKWAGV